MQAFVSSVTTSLQCVSGTAVGNPSATPLSLNANVRSLHIAPSLLPNVSKSSTKPEPTPPNVALTSQVTVVWLREELRVHDNPALLAAVATKGMVAPLAILPAEPSGFLLSALNDLRQTLRGKGGELYVRTEAESVSRTVASFCSEVGANTLCFHREVSKISRGEEEQVAQAVKQLGVEVRSFWTNCLITPTELPFDIKDMPDDCDAFAERVRHLPIRHADRAPESVPSVVGVVAGHLPLVSERGGENVGLEKVKEYIKGGLVAKDRFGIDTRFSRLGAFLAHGCLSPRLVWQQVVKQVSEKSVRRYCAEFELQLRDFFRLMTLKNGVHPV